MSRRLPGELPPTAGLPLRWRDFLPGKGPLGETLAGLVYESLNRVPEEDEMLETEGLHIIIKKMKGPKIVLAKVLKLD